MTIAPVIADLSYRVNDKIEYVNNGNLQDKYKYYISLTNKD